MKKSIFALLFLLLILVGTCVYQKTYALYALEHNEERHTLQVTEVKKPKHLKKEKKQGQTTKHSALTNSIVKNEKSNKLLIDKKSPEAPSFLEKLKTTVTKAITGEDKKTIVVTPIKKKEQPSIVMAKKETLNTKIKEEEVVDYLLSVLKEQENALSKRDASEEVLHSLIKRVLEERHLAIKNMEKASLDINTKHQEKLNQRDIASQNIDKTHTEKKGK